MLKVAAFYLKKQKSFIPKKIFLGRSLYMSRDIQKMVFAVLIFSDGFANNVRGTAAANLFLSSSNRSRSSCLPMLGGPTRIRGRFWLAWG